MLQGSQFLGKVRAIVDLPVTCSSASKSGIEAESLRLVGGGLANSVSTSKKYSRVQDFIQKFS